jgi:hypothetical protein
VTQVDECNNDESATAIKIFRYCAILNRRTLASVGMLLDEQTPGGGLFKLTSQNSSDSGTFFASESSEGNKCNGDFATVNAPSLDSEAEQHLASFDCKGN